MFTEINVPLTVLRHIKQKIMSVTLKPQVEMRRQKGGDFDFKKVNKKWYAEQAKTLSLKGTEFQGDHKGWVVRDAPSEGFTIHRKLCLTRKTAWNSTSGGGWIPEWQLVKRGCQAERWQRWPVALLAKQNCSRAQPELLCVQYSSWGHFQLLSLFCPPYNKPPVTEITSLSFYSLSPERL